MIGAKTVTACLLLLVASALGWYVGLSPARLASLGASEAFWAGFFAFLAGSAVYRYWRLHERSTYYFRWCDDEALWADEAHFVGGSRRRIVIGENLGDAFDLGPRVHYAISVTLAFWVGLITLDGRAVELLGRIPDRIGGSGSDYCPEEQASAPLELHEDPGCALIRRAYQLGFAKSLGPCEPKPKEDRLRICTLRQRDEPLLHYAWRRLDTFYGAVAEQVTEDRLVDMKAAFDLRTRHLDELYAARGFVVGGAPRASHHIFTNLPDPGGWVASMTGDVLRSKSCDERYRRLPHRVPPVHDGLEASRELDHILGQLLFDTRYTRAAGACREYTIHWGAPADACERLADDPVAFLEKQGALAGVRKVLRRYRVTVELQDGGMSALARILREVPPERFVSFQCYIEDERAKAHVSRLVVSLDGERFNALEMLAPATVGVGAVRYQQIAAMLAPSFHYGNLLSEAAPGEREAGIDGRFFEPKSDGFISRLDYLGDVDIFLGRSWIEDRSDLLDVYPYNLHLQNYVELFRARYRSERGRL